MWMQHEDAGDRNQEVSIHGRYLITIVKIVRNARESATNREKTTPKPSLM